ncbi:MAG: cyclophilin-like fold protein [Roseburia sp.]|nr:cyclophilin-like fold protein [Roseburia sp.]
MKRYIAAIFTLLLPLVMAACGSDRKPEESGGTAQNTETIHTDSAPEPGIEPEPEQELRAGGMEEMEDGTVETDQFYIKVGESTLTAVLEDNESAETLKEFLADGPVTISASNYGGFEKVCSLGTRLPRNDSQTTTHAGDICLYNGNQIVIFYGSNSWAYTRLGRVSDADAAELEEVLSGEETEITLSLEPFH